MFPRLRHLTRANEIVATFARHGFATLLKSSGLTQFLPIKVPVPEGAAATAKALREICEELGPTFIKLGQIASTRSDLLSQEYLEELRKLQDNASPVDPELVRDAILEELGESPDELFADFEELPRASASIGQVHGAMLKDGTRVVMKVQRPGIVEQVKADMDILKTAALWIDRHSEIGKKYDLPGVVEDFSSTLFDELSYLKEGRNAERLRKNLRSDTDTRAFYIPRVYWDFTTDRVICWEEISGHRIEDLDAADIPGLRRPELARDFLNGYLQQIFIDGYYHADPHPGNLRILHNGRLALMDFGMMGQLNRDMMEQFANMISSLVEKDSYTLASTLVEMAGKDSSQLDFKAFRSDIAAYIQTYYGTSMVEVPFGQAFTDLIDIGYRQGLRLPGDLAILTKTVWNIEVMARTLDPKINMIEVLKPFSTRLLEERLLHPHLKWTMIKGLLDWRDLFSELPERSKKLMEKVEEGRFRMELEYRGIDNLAQQMRDVGHSLSVSVIASGGLIGGALIASHVSQPMMWPTSLGVMFVGGWVGYMLGLWSWRAMRRK